MKPKEFDELVRDKIDQGGFAYSPEAWGKLAEQMDGRAKKRSIMLWWWVPATGIAASIALAIGISSMNGGSVMHKESAAAEVAQAGHIYNTSQGAADNISNAGNAPATAAHKAGSLLHRFGAPIHKARKQKPETNAAEDFGLTMDMANSAARPVYKAVPRLDLLKKQEEEDKKIKKENIAAARGYNTFKPEETAAPAPKVSLVLLGGINRGSQGSGYAAGATARRMITDKLYIESDIAIASSSNTQSTKYYVPGEAIKAVAKTLAPASKTDAVPLGTAGNIKTADQAYNLYYAQVSPSLGYKLLKKLSVGAGPDFQQLLVDNRPALSTADRNNLQTAPSFDIGFIGRTEYALTKKIKAAVYYREGMNNIITLTNSKYIDRNYVQFQMKYTIFNK